MNKMINFLKTNPFWFFFLVGVVIYLISLIPFDFQVFWLYTLTCIFTAIKIYSYYVICPNCNKKVYKGKKCKKCGYIEEDESKYKKHFNIKAILFISLGLLAFLLFIYILIYFDHPFSLLNPSSEVLYAYFDTIKDLLPIIIASILTSLILRIVIKHYVINNKK